MIYLITGVPGSGKSLYAVSTLVQELVAQRVVIDGVETTRRLVVDNIPGLLLDHVLMAPGKFAQGQVEPTEDGDGLWNWHKWCKPGDVIVVDEVQRHWRPRGAGTKVKEEIAMLETHRHFGVDFVIITQNGMLLDQNVRRLVGRHQNVRRILGMKRAIIYDWDGYSQTMNPSTATGKSFFNYPKSAYSLYKSSELHTKQKQKIPLWVFVPVLALVGGVAFGPKAYAVLVNAGTGKGIESAKASSLPSATVPLFTASAPALGASAPVLARPVEPLAPIVKYSGCIVVRERCGCFDEKGIKVDVSAEVCQVESGFGREKPAEFADSPTVHDLTESERDTLRFAFARK